MYEKNYIDTHIDRQDLSKIDTTKLLRAFAADERRRVAETERPLRFAYGRLRVVNAVLAYHHGGPCRTDDGEIYLDLMLPYSVEIAALRKDAGFEAAMRRLRYWLPKTMAELGPDEMARRWNEMNEYRSFARSCHALWLPTAAQIRDDLRLRYADRLAINALYPDRPPIQGIPVIDPLSDNERREADRYRKTVKRRADGVQAQETRTTRANDKALAVLAGCTDRTIRTHRLNETLDAFLAKRGIDPLGISQKCPADKDHLWDGQKWEANENEEKTFADILTDEFVIEEAA